MKYPIRSQITAPKGKLLLAVDLSQAEAWIVAYLANEPNMKKELAGGDIHTLSARIIFENESLTKKDENERYLGKKMNHSCNYRTGPFMIAVMINKESDKPPYVTVSVKQTKVYHKRWTDFFQLALWWREIEEQLNINRTLITPYRRKRMFFEQWGDSLFKEATAFIPQSTVADHMYGYVQPEVGISGGLLGVKRTILDRYKDILLVNSAHDSALFEVPEKDIPDITEMVKGQLARPIEIKGEQFIIPVDSDIYERYGEKNKELKERFAI